MYGCWIVDTSASYVMLLLWIGYESSRDLKSSHNSHCMQLGTHMWPGWDCCYLEIRTAETIHTLTTSLLLPKSQWWMHTCQCVCCPLVDTQRYHDNNKILPCASPHYRHRWIHSRFWLKIKTKSLNWTLIQSWETFWKAWIQGYRIFLQSCDKWIAWIRF